jgi:hypothetical protein
MKNKKHKYKNMSEESLKFGNSKKQNKYCSNESGVFTEIIMLFVFSFFLILSWLGFFKLLQFQYIFTIYRYINHSFSTYFPIQLTSNFLILIFLFTEIIITLISTFFIIKLIAIILKKRTNKLFKKKPILISIPIFSNSLLFLLGILIKNNNESLNFYYIGLIIDEVSLFALLKINFDKKINHNFFNIDYDNDFMGKAFEDYLFEILLALDLYYCYYVIFQIIYFYSNYNTEILNFSGIVINFSMGLVSLYTNFNLKSIGFNIMYFIIYLGIFIFQFTIREEERKEYQVGYGEIISSLIFLIYFFVENIYLICMNIDND